MSTVVKYWIYLQQLSKVHLVHVYHIESTLIDSKQSKIANFRNFILSTILSFVHQGWPDNYLLNKLRLYHIHKEELTIEDNIMLWKLQQIVFKTRNYIMLNLLNDIYINVVWIKYLTRLLVWLLSINFEIERVCL